MKPKFRSLIAAFAPLHRSSLIVVAFVTAGLSQSTQAAPLTWSGADDGLWNDAASWTPSQTPTTADALTILGPANVAGALVIDVNAPSAADTIGFTNTAATTLSNLAAVADQTLTLQNGLTTGTGAVTIGSATIANAGVLVALGASQSWNIGAGNLTANNIISGSGVVLTKTGAGTLTLLGANTYNGGTTLSTGTLTATDAATNNFVKALGTGLVTLNAGTLNLRANGSASTQTIITGDGTTGNDVTVGGNSTISVDRVSANTGSTFRFNNLSIGANTLTVNTANTYALQFAGTTTLTGNATFNNTANLTLTGAVGDGGSGFGITKQGAGTLTLSSGANTYTGNTNVTAGVLLFNSLGGAGANVTVAAGAAVGAAFAADQTFVNRIATTSAGTIALGADTSANLDMSAFGSLSLGASGAFNYNGTALTPNGSTYRLGGGGGTLSITNSNVLTGARDLLVGASGGTGTVSLKAAQNYSGSTTVNSGTLQLASTGANTTIGSILNTSGIFLNLGGTLALANDATNGISTNRIADTTAITLNGGAFNFGASTAGTTDYSETVGQLNVASGGQNRVITPTGVVAGSTSTLTFASLNRTAGTSVSFSSNTNIGTTRNKILFTSAPTVDDGGLIGGWATIASVDFAAYDTTVPSGVKFPTYQTNSLETAWLQDQNIKLTTGTTTLTANRQINSLLCQMTASANVALGGFTLRVESGGILASGGTVNASVAGGNLTAGQGNDTAAELFVMVSQANTRPITVSANIVDNGTGVVSLVTNGGVNNAGGHVIISGANTYTGTTTAIGGTTRMGSALVNNKALTVATGAVVNLGGLTHTVDGLFGGGTIGTNNSADAGASNSLLSVGNSNGSATFTGNLTTSGLNSRDLDIVKNGTGTQLITGTDFRDLTAATSGAGGSTTTINNGIYQAAKQLSLYNNNASRWTAALITVNSGGMLALNVGGTGEFTSANVDTIKAIGTATGGFLTGSNLGLDTTNAAGGNFTYSTAIGNTFAGANVFALTKLGTGTLTLNSTGNGYSGGTTILGGTLNIDSVWQLGGAVYGGLTFGAAGGTLQYATTLLNGATDITQDTSDGGLGINGVQKNVTFTGNATIDTNGHNVSYKFGLGNSGAGGLTKTGAGTLTLNGSNNYTGATAVSVGKLEVVGTLGATAVTVSNLATLGGNGNIGGPVSIASGGRHALAVATTTGAQVTRAITGTLTLTAGNVLDLTAASQPAAGTYVLASATSISGTPTSVNYTNISGGSVAVVGNELRLTVSGGGSSYDSWASTNGVPGQASDLDHDNDGVDNGVEYFIGGNTNTTGFTALPGVTTAAGVRSVTWTHAASYTGTYGTGFVVQTSATLAAGSWVNQASPGTVAISGNNVTYTFPAGPVKNFVRLVVTPN